MTKRDQLLRGIKLHRIIFGVTFIVTMMVFVWGLAIVSEGNSSVPNAQTGFVISLLSVCGLLCILSFSFLLASFIAVRYREFQCDNDVIIFYRGLFTTELYINDGLKDSNMMRSYVEGKLSDGSLVHISYSKNSFNIRAVFTNGKPPIDLS